MKYWLSAVGGSAGGASWETEPRPVEMELDVEMTDDDLASIDLVFLDDDITTGRVPLDGWVTHMVLRTDPGGPPWKLLAIPPNAQVLREG